MGWFVCVSRSVVVLTCVSLVVACDAPKKSVGNESDATDTDSSESAGESGSESTGMGAELPDGWEGTLMSRGCGDMTIYGVNPEDTLVLVTTIRTEMVKMAAESEDDPLAFEVDVADFEVFRVDVGQNVEVELCTDVVEQPAVIDATWTAISGTATFSVSSGPEPEFNGGADATVTFTDVVLENGGVQIPMPTLTFTDVSVGWLPG